MSKLLNFKEWLTIKDASKYLSNTFKEKVKIKDIYRLALDNKLMLSLHFINSIYVEKSIITSPISFRKKELENDTLVFEKQYQLIKAGCCYDMINTCHGQLILKQAYYGDRFDLKLESNKSQGIIFMDDDNEGFCFYRLISYLENNCKLSQIKVLERLSKNILLVVRTQYLQELIINSKAPNTMMKPLHCKERISLYKVIAILAEMNHLSHDKKFKTANIIKTYADSIGFDCPSSHTIAKYLKEASSYLPMINNLN